MATWGRFGGKRGRVGGEGGSEDDEYLAPPRNRKGKAVFFFHSFSLDLGPPPGHSSLHPTAEEKEEEEDPQEDPLAPFQFLGSWRCHTDGGKRTKGEAGEARSVGEERTSGKRK